MIYEEIIIIILEEIIIMMLKENYGELYNYDTWRDNYYDA